MGAPACGETFRLRAAFGLSRAPIRDCLSGMKGRAALAAMIGAALAAGCVAPVRETAAPPVRPLPAPPPPVYSNNGLEGVMGKSARALVALFGNPDLDDREGPARKLQFLGPICVLDAYLYPPRAGAEPVVTHVDARLPDGRDMDRSSCVAALSRRQEAR
jgi:hypothetical protein